MPAGAQSGDARVIWGWGWQRLIKKSPRKKKKRTLSTGHKGMSNELKFLNQVNYTKMRDTKKLMEFNYLTSAQKGYSSPVQDGGKKQESGRRLGISRNNKRGLS